MLDTYDIHDYDEDFLERFIHQILPVYDLWSIRALRNDQKIIIDGSAKDTQKISDFLQNESSKQYPMDLLIILGTAEKGNPKLMLTRKRAYFKIRFDKNHNNEIGSPGFLDSDPRCSYNDQFQMFRSGIRGIGSQQGNYQQDMQGMIESVSRSIRAEYDEMAAKKESEALRRHNELESKFEAYKLAVQEQALNERKRALDEQAQELQMMHEELEAKRLEGLGTVKDYTKVIAGGLFEMGKTWLGLDFEKNEDEEVKSSKPKAPNSKEKEDELSNVKTKYKYDDDDDGFQLVKKDDLQEEPLQNKNEKTLQENIAILKGILKDLPAEVKLELLNDFIPEYDDDEEFQQVTDGKTGTEEKTIQLNGLDGILELIEDEKTDDVKTGNNDVKTGNVNGKLKNSNVQTGNVNVQPEYNITNHFLANDKHQNIENIEQQLNPAGNEEIPP